MTNYHLTVASAPQILSLAMSQQQEDWWSAPLSKQKWWVGILLVLLVVALPYALGAVLTFAKKIPAVVKRLLLRSCEHCGGQNYFWDRRWIWFEGEYRRGGGEFSRRMHAECAKAAAANLKLWKETDAALEAVERDRREGPMASANALLAAAEGQKQLSPDLLRRVLAIYREAEQETWFGRERSDAAWTHIERFERPGARKRFEEAGALKRACLRSLEKAARQPGANSVLRETRSEMANAMNAYNPMTDDSAYDIAARESYRVTVELIDRLLK